MFKFIGGSKSYLWVLENHDELPKNSRNVLFFLRIHKIGSRAGPASCSWRWGIKFCSIFPCHWFLVYASMGKTAEGLGCIAAVVCTHTHTPCSCSQLRVREHCFRISNLYLPTRAGGREALNSQPVIGSGNFGRHTLTHVLSHTHVRTLSFINPTFIFGWWCVV